MSDTFRQVLNSTLRAIGEDEIDGSLTELSDTYHLFLLEIFNQFKEEIEEAVNWRALHQTIPVTITANTRIATITGATDRSRLVRVNDQHSGQFIPLVFDVTDSDEPTPLKELDLATFIYKESIDPVTTASDEPTWFAIDNTAGDVLKLRVFPKPTTQRTINVTLVVPQAPFASDDLSVVVSIPTRALKVALVWYALQERGEELGAGSLFTEERYRTALDDAVSREVAESGSLDLVPT